MRRLFLLSSLFIFNFLISNAQPGALDYSFGKKGIVTTNIGSRFDYTLEGKKLLVLADGSFFTIHARYAAICKRLTNGSIDSSYGNNGFSTPTHIDAIDAVLQSDGKIVVLDSRFFMLARYNTSGNLDSTYGIHGIITATDFGGEAIPNSLAIQKDGKIVVCGMTSFNGDSHFAVSRYNIDGSLDKSFSGDGKVHTGFPFTIGADYFEDGEAKSVVIQSDGKIVVAGAARGDFAIISYNVDGSLDNTFSEDGKQTTNFGSDEHATFLSLQKDGKIVVSGYTYLQNQYYGFAIARYNFNGSLDNSFSGDGKQTTATGTMDFLFSSAAIQADGKIVVAGHSWNGTNNDFILNRYNVNGSLDSTFDRDGKTITNFNAGDDYATSLVIQGSGKILLIGYSYTYSPLGVYLNSVVARYNPSGILDNTFDGDGKLIERYNQGYTAYRSTGIQKDRKVVVAGWTWNGKNYDIAIIRYNTNGSLDRTFDGDGTLITDFGSVESDPFIKIQNDGKIVVAATSGLGNSNVIIARFNSNGSIDSTFNGDGRYNTNFGFPSAGANAIAIQSDGKILISCSIADTNSDIGFLIARFNANGSIDSTFSRVGIATMPRGQSLFIAPSLALQPDGRILAAGYDDANFKIIRYNTNGSLDNSFNGNGIQTTDFGFPDEMAYDVVVQGDGKILVAGGTRGMDSKCFLARYNTNGSLDTTFSSDGKQSNDFRSANSYVTSLALESNGKILVAGISDENSFLARYNSNGSLDNTFSKDGLELVKIGRAERNLPCIVIASGKVYFIAHTAAPGILGFIARYLLTANKPPTVSITTPVNNTVYAAPASITIRATATDGDGIISNVKFYNGTTYLKTVFTAPYTYTLSNLPKGTYTLTAKATDNTGLQATSKPVTVTVLQPSANKAPVITITNPLNNSSYTTPTTFTLNASASDPDGTITSVKFYRGAVLLKTATTSPYTCPVSNLPAGTYSFTAVATDNKGLISSSSSVSIGVSVPLNKAPVVKITNPINNVVYTSPATINITATATDADGTIARIKFYRAGTLLGVDSISPYTFTITNAAIGSYSLVAKATDNKGLTSSSASIAVQVAGTTAIVSSKGLAENNEPILNEDVSVKLTPNPTTNILNIYTKGFKPDKLIFINVISPDGVVLKTMQSNASNKKVQLDVSSLLKGVYIITVTSGDKIINKQFVKL